MSTPTKLLPGLQNVEDETNTFAPPVADAITKAEEQGGSGLQKLGTALSILAGNPAINQANPNVGAIVGLVNVGVLFANLFGIFKHKTPAEPAAPAAPAKTTT